jgi:hypothetical protein
LEALITDLHLHIQQGELSQYGDKNLGYTRGMGKISFPFFKGTKTDSAAHTALRSIGTW